MKNIEVLKDQLTCVDSAYFSTILDALEDKDITSSYIASIVEKLYS